MRARLREERVQLGTHDNSPSQRWQDPAQQKWSWRWQKNQFNPTHAFIVTSLVAQTVKNLLAMQET